MIPRPAPAVAGEHDLPLDGDTELGELFVVLGDPVVHVDDFPGNVPVRGVGVVGQEATLIGGILVLGDARLGQPQRVRLGSDHLDVPVDRKRHERLRHLDLGLESKGPELLQRVIGDALAAVSEAGDVRLLGHELHVLPEPGRIGNRPESLLQSALFLPLASQESPWGFLRLGFGRQRKGDGNGEKKKRKNWGTAHDGKSYPPRASSNRWGAAGPTDRLA